MPRAKMIPVSNCRVVENTKEYVCRAMVTVVDHLGNVTSNLESCISQTNAFNEVELRLNCLNQVCSLWFITTAFIQMYPMACFIKNLWFLAETPLLCTVCSKAWTIPTTLEWNPAQVSSPLCLSRWAITLSRTPTRFSFHLTITCQIISFHNSAVPVGKNMEQLTRSSRWTFFFVIPFFPLNDPHAYIHI